MQRKNKQWQQYKLSLNLSLSPLSEYTCRTAHLHSSYTTNLIDFSVSMGGLNFVFLKSTQIEKKKPTEIWSENMYWTSVYYLEELYL